MALVLSHKIESVEFLPHSKDYLRFDRLDDPFCKSNLLLLGLCSNLLRPLWSFTFAGSTFVPRNQTRPSASKYSQLSLEQRREYIERTNSRKRETIQLQKDNSDGSSAVVNKRRKVDWLQRAQAMTLDEQAKMSTEEAMQSQEIEEAQVEHTPITSLQINQKRWTIKVVVLRLGSPERYSNARGSGEVWKIIIADEEGTRVEVVMFNDAISKFEPMLKKGTTYFISDGTVRPANQNFTNVNKQIELSLPVTANIIEAPEEIAMDNILKDFLPIRQAIHKGPTAFSKVAM
ncbi:hypothetical protein RJ640_012608 [Escallonia rubra]|uniref:OB domain-containing protein n=1 Tax=Escallonia rubra TaxID=112253 RepID=A0AA88UFA5_9ASTE|nr:hypothetical protein RJ640_012608 [Escallonia rubra]